jgi:outer membrane lipopolysaccharide assembly protein LptE/RlpB
MKNMLMTMNNKEDRMKKIVKIAALIAAVATLTACTGHVQNKANNCSYDYLLHPAISISKIVGGCGPAAAQ